MTLLEALGRAIPDERLVTDPDVVASLSGDEAEWAPVGTAAVALRARTEAEVAARGRASAPTSASRSSPRGAGTGLSGGANAVDGCVVLDLSRMDRGPRDRPRQPGLRRRSPASSTTTSRRPCAEHGLWYPPDPASAPWSTIGGNVATNAGGLCCLKYGVTRDYVLGLRASWAARPATATSSGSAGGPRRASPGYDLAGLMVGSEGTLGVVTEVTLRLRPGAGRHAAHRRRRLRHPRRRRAAPSPRSPGAGLTPSALELLDRACLQAVEDWKHLGLEADAAALLLARVDTPGRGRRRRGARAWSTRSSAAGALWAAESSDDAEAEALFAARRLAYPALERLGPVLTEDVCVPRSAGARRCSAGSSEIAARHDVRDRHHRARRRRQPAPAAHHPARRRRGPRARRRPAFEEILDAAIALGGTVTGEHGVGLLKRDGHAPRARPARVELQRGDQGDARPARHLQPRQGALSRTLPTGRPDVTRLSATRADMHRTPM